MLGDEADEIVIAYEGTLEPFNGGARVFNRNCEEVSSRQVDSLDGPVVVLTTGSSFSSRVDATLGRLRVRGSW